MRYGLAQYRMANDVRERLCMGCQRWIVRTPEFFYKEADKADGLSSQCIECLRPKSRERMRRKAQHHTAQRRYAQAAIEARA